MAFNFPAVTYIIALIADAFLIFFSIFHVIAFDELKTDYKNPIDQCNSLNPVSSSFYFSCFFFVCENVINAFVFFNAQQKIHLQKCSIREVKKKSIYHNLTFSNTVNWLLFTASDPGVFTTFGIQRSFPVGRRMVFASIEYSAHCISCFQVNLISVFFGTKVACNFNISIYFRYKNRPVMSGPGLYDPTSIMNAGMLNTKYSMRKKNVSYISVHNKLYL